MIWEAPTPGYMARSYMGLDVRNWGVGARKNWVNGAWVGARKNWVNGAYRRDGTDNRGTKDRWTYGVEHSVCIVFPHT